MKVLTLLLALVLFSCSNTNDTNEGSRKWTFGELVDLEKLEKVRMHTNAGTFDLTGQQVEKIKEDLSGMAYAPEMSAKVGAISIELTIAGETHTVSSATHGNYMEVPANMVIKNKEAIGTTDWLYFETGGVNFDNYKEENP